jgi:3-oxoacyl-[acyl-carrier protein] reductase
VAVVETDLDASAEDAEPVVPEVAAHGVDVVGLLCDVTDPAAADGTGGRVDQRLGRGECLRVQRRGGTGPIHGNRASEVEVGDLEGMLRLNLFLGYALPGVLGRSHVGR